MTINKKKILTLLSIGMLILTGCSTNPNTIEQIPATSPASVATQTSPAAAITEAPATATPEPAPPSPTMNAPSHPGSVPAIPNVSKITGKILSVTTDDTGIYVELEVLSSEAVPGFGNFGARVVGTNIKAQWMDQSMPIANPDVVITGELRYRGDEKGGLYLLSQVK